MDIKVNGRTLSDRPLVLGVQGDNNVEELRFLVPRYTDAGVDLSLGIGYAVFQLSDGTDGHVSLTPEVLDTDENTVSLTLLVGSQMTEQKGSGKLCLKVAGLESAMWSSTICDMFVNGTIAMPSPQPYSLFRTMSVGSRLAEDESEPPLTVTERTINIPAELQTIAVAQDENSETVKIVVPRYFDGQDLSVHDFILHTEMGSNGTDDILFNNQNGQMKAVEDSTVTLTWVLRPPQTSFEGKLNIQLLVQGEEFKWHSLIGELTIAKHITGDPVVPATPSMYEQWLAEVKEQADYVRSQAANIQTVVDEMGAIKDAPAAAERAEAAAAEAEKFAAESKGFRTFHGAVTPDANGNLDPSRPMAVGPAASVEIESAGDRIQSVTALGFTQQAGTGDPSPSNVRAITNGGKYFNVTVYTGQESWSAYSGKANTFSVFAGATIYGGVSSYYAGLTAGELGTKDGIYLSNTLSIIITDLSCSSADEFKGKLQELYAAGTPLIVWCNKLVNGAEEKWEPGKTLYAPIILNSGEYRATCLPLTAPLCEGDSVVSWVKSGCDQVITLTGANVRGASGGNVYFGTDSGATIDNLPTMGTGFAVCDNTFQFSNTTYWACLTAGKFTYGNGQIGVYDAVNTTKELAQEYYNAHPLTVRYRSTNYNEAADIPVSLETHQQAVLVLDGTEAWSVHNTSSAGITNYKAEIAFPVSKTSGASACSHYKPITLAYATNTQNNVVCAFTTGTLAIASSDYESVDALKAYLAAQYSAGTPVTIVYQLATTITYAHEAVVLEAATGDQLTYTVTGQSGGTVSVALKPFQDGGNAKLLDGLTLAALQNLIAPIGYTFEWAPVEGGPDLSTPAKVAEYFGFGTWAAYGTGQVLVGVDSGQTEFATAGKTGGEKTHTLTTSEVPPQNVSAELDSKPRPVMVDAGVDNTDYGCTFNIDKGYKAKPATKFQTEGGGQAHNNLQPYVVVYRWQRVA